MTKFRFKTVSPSTIDKATSPIYIKYHELLADKYGSMPDDWEGWRIDMVISLMAENNHGRIDLEDFEATVGQYVSDYEEDIGERAIPMREIYDSIIDYFRVK